MHDFTAIGNTLYGEDCRIKDIARETGTPVYIYSSKTIADHFSKIQKSFASHPTEICYSVKANSNIHILSLLGRLGAGADIVSGGELHRVLKAGVPPGRIVYSGVGKTDAEIEFALGQKIRFFNVESVPEMHRINEIAGRLGTTARISIRVNPDVDAHTHQFTTTGKKENKFGLSVSGIEEHYRTAAGLRNLEIVGIDVHLGSPILKIEPYLRTLEILKVAVSKLRAAGIHLTVLDIGGGLGIVYKDESAFTAQDFADAVLPKVKAMNLDLVIEPGRFIVGNAGILVTSVIYVKTAPVKTFVIVDAGMNDLIRPCLYDSYHQIKSVTDVLRPTMTADVVGPICESSDFFAKDREVPRVETGDLLAIMSAGAYGFSMSSNYNSRPRACEALIEGSSWRIIRKRETYDDLIRTEIL